MPSKQRQPSIQQSPVPQFPRRSGSDFPKHQQQLAHLVAELIQRVRTAAQDQGGRP